jgi:hypothetical protein
MRRGQVFRSPVSRIELACKRMRVFWEAINPLSSTEEDRSVWDAIRTARREGQLCIVSGHRGARKSTALTRLKLRHGLMSKIIVVKSPTQLYDALGVSIEWWGPTGYYHNKERAPVVTAVGALFLYCATWCLLGCPFPWEVVPPPLDLVTPLAPVLPFLFYRLRKPVIIIDEVLEYYGSAFSVKEIQKGVLRAIRQRARRVPVVMITANAGI